MDTCINTRTGYTFTLDGAIVPKARPRVTSRGTFMPPAYRAWKSAAIACLRSQAAQQGLIEPIPRATVSILLMGKHPRRGDCDNISGSILDALVQGGILANDNLNCVPALSIALDYDKRSPTVTCDIRVVTGLSRVTTA